MENKITLSEKLFLLSINPEKGGIINGGGSFLNYSIIAALLMELQSDGNIVVENKKIIIKSFKTKSSIGSYILSKFEKYDKPLKISRWFNKLIHSVKFIKDELKSGLSDKRIIRLENRKFLFFKWKRPYILEKLMVRALGDKIKSLIYSGSVDDEWKPLLSLIEPSNVFKRLFRDRNSRKNARRKLRGMNPDNEISIILKRTIAAANAAAVAAST